MSGWIKLYRDTLDNPVVCKDAEYFSVWIYLLLNATHKEIKMEFNGKVINLLPGQLITGRKCICKALKVDEHKVDRILKRLENEHQIEQLTTSKGRLISILNWSMYQEIEQQNEQQLSNDCTTTEQQVSTNKNVKNVKNDNNVRSNNKDRGRFTPPTVSEVQNYCTERSNGIDADQFINFYEAKGWMVGKNKMKDWKAAIRTWEKRNSPTQTGGNRNTDNSRSHTEIRRTQAELIQLGKEWDAGEDEELPF